jgi:hypothetical protein
MEGYSAPCTFEDFQALVLASEMGGLDDDGHIDPLI